MRAPRDNVVAVRSARWRKLISRMFPELPAQAAPVFSKLSTPHQFNPALGLGIGLVAVGAALARIAAFCVVFAFWGVLSLLAWNGMASRFWRAVALVPLILALPAALIPPLLAIGAVERWMLGRR